MRFGNQVLRNPIYKISRWSDADFFRQSLIPLTQLGIEGGSVTVVDVLHHTGKDVVRPGAQLFVRNQNNIITLWNGMYLELVRKGTPCGE
jgi:TctA family transporter